MMFDGSITPVEDVKTGDKLMGPDNLPRTVLKTTSGVGPLYKINPSNATEYIVNDKHLLSLRRSKYKSDRYPDVDVLTVTPEEYINLSYKKKANFYGYKSSAIELPKKDLLIPPYILGIWLGDGCSDRQSITSMDEEVISEFVRWGETYGCHESRRMKKGQKSYTVILTNAQGQPNQAKEAFKSLGVLNNKHVPEDYHISSLEDRLNFLAGILDTDGHCRQGYFEVTQKRHDIALSIKRIADTCGFRTSIKYNEAKCEGKLFPCYRVRICGDISRIPNKVTHKQCKTERYFKILLISC